MNKREKILISVIVIFTLLIGGVIFKTIQYRTKLIETKKVVVKQKELIKGKDETILKSVKLGYESVRRLEYLDATRTDAIRHPDYGSKVEFQVILKKAWESSEKYNDFLIV